MLTDFGRYMRDFRIRKNLLLKDMADALNYSSAYVSGIETGQIPIPPDYFWKVRVTYDMTPTEYLYMRRAANAPITAITIDLEDESEIRKELISKFVEVLSNFSDDELEEIVSRYWKAPEPITIDTVIENMKKRDQDEL